MQLHGLNLQPVIGPVHIDKTLDLGFQDLRDKGFNHIVDRPCGVSSKDAPRPCCSRK